jgi:hypothetical protein
VAEQTAALLGRDIERHGGMHEYCVPETGEGVMNLGFMNWNCLVANMLRDLGANIAEEKIAGRPMDDEADIGADADGPEALVPCLVESVEAEAGIGGVQLQVKGGCLDGLLFIACEAGKTVGEGVCNPEVHGTSWKQVQLRRRCEFGSPFHLLGLLQ